MLDIAQIKQMAADDKVLELIIVISCFVGGAAWGARKIIADKLSITAFEDWTKSHLEKHVHDQDKLEIKLDRIISMVERQVQGAESQIDITAKDLQRMERTVAEMAARNDATLDTILKMFGLKNVGKNKK